MNYATIEEAWGDLSGRRKKKSKTQDPICDLYEQKVNTSAYSQLDLVNNSNDQFEKSKYQRNMDEDRESIVKNVIINEQKQYYDISDQESKSLFEKQFDIKHPDLFSEECEAPQKPARPVYKPRQSAPHPTRTYPVVYPENYNRNARENYDDGDSDDVEEYIYKRQPYYEQYLDDYGYTKKTKSNLVYVDLILYLISGIILIFLLEQFVQIGKNMVLL